MPYSFRRLDIDDDDDDDEEEAAGCTGIHSIGLGLVSVGWRRNC